jgi:hypothetical protein
MKIRQNRSFQWTDLLTDRLDEAKWLFTILQTCLMLRIWVSALACVAFVTKHILCQPKHNL